MKLTRSLTLSDNKPHVIEDRVLLQLNNPGRAGFLVHSPKKTPELGKMVAFDIGYTQQSNQQRLFVGFIQKITPKAGDQYQLFCREMSAILNSPLPLNLRHVTLKDVLTEINQKIGLNFSIPDKKYSNTLIANFYNLGNGYQAMLQLGVLFKIPDYIWQQQGQGVIYVGSWADSRWSGKTIALPENLFNDQTSQNSVKVMAIPALRPGVSINARRIESMEFSNQHMILNWSKS